MNKPIGALSRPAEILHVDDDADYLHLTREVFKMSKLAVNLHHAKDGEQCMAFLRKQGPYADAPSPDIVLLNLNMPRMDGREVLAAICKEEGLRHLPVVILTASEEDQVVHEMYQLRVSSYIIKPVDLNELIRFIQSFADYWLTVAVLPSTR